MTKYILILIMSLSNFNTSASINYEDQDTFKLLCLNSWMIPFLRRKATTRSLLIGREASKYDFVMLQEVFNRRQRRLITRAINKEEKFYNRFQPTRWMRAKTNSGKFNLSKHKITKSSFKLFSVCGGAQCWSDKGVLHTRVELPNGVEIDIYNTHLQPFSNGKKIRQLQINEMLAHIEKTNDGKRAVILTGDLNIHGGGEEYQEVNRQLEEFGLFDAWTTLNYPDPGYTWDSSINRWARGFNGSTKSKSRLDYIYVKNGSRDKVELLSSNIVFDEPYSLRPNSRKYFLSDHFGVDIEFKVHSK